MNLAVILPACVANGTDHRRSGINAPPASSTISGSVVVEGRPSQGVIIYVLGLGTAVTNTAGTFSIGGAKSGVVYETVIQRTGFSFSPPRLTVSAGQSISAMGTQVSFNPRGCPVSDVTGQLNEAASQARMFKEMVYADSARLGGHGAKRAFGDHHTSAASASQRTDAQLYSYMLNSSAIPEVRLDCTDPTGCTSVSIFGSAVGALQEVGNLRREALQVNRVLRMRKMRTERESNLRIRDIRRANRTASSLFEEIGDQTFQCEPI